MDAIRMLLSRCAALFKRQDLDKDLDEELEGHIEMATEENRARGMNEQAARTAALRDFGGATQAKEAYRTQRALFLETLAQDIRFAGRQLRRSPGFTVTAVLTLALGIGGNTAVFSIVNGVLLNPLPFPHSEQLVGLHESKPNFENGSISYPNFLDWRNNNHSFSWMAVARGYSFTFTGRGDAEQVNADFISSGYFSLLGVRPILGREFMQTEDQPGASPAAMISEGLWRRKFGASSNIVGQTITLDSKNFLIVGVVPASLEVRTQGFRNLDVYAPIPQWSNSVLMNRGAGLGFHGIARLKPGVSVEQARADMAQLTRNLAEEYPDADRGIGASIIPLKEQLVGSTRQFLLVLLAAVGFVLLIACVNVASLLLAKSAGRSREFAVRTALGASRARVIRQLLTESLFLGIAAGVLGTIPAIVGMHAALKMLPSALPRSGEIGVDFRVLAFTTILSLLTGTLFGLAPALKISKGDTQSGLKDGGRGTSRTQGRALGTFVVVEIAVALVLLTGAGLMIRSMVRLWDVDPGFNAKNVLTLGLSLPPTTASASPDAIRATMRELNTRFRAA
jgi:predicted permease